MSPENSSIIIEAFHHLSKAIALMAQAGQPEQQTDPDAPGALNRKGACNYLSIGTTKFGELVREGKIPKGVDIGGRPHWFPEDLDKYLRRVKRQKGN